jgi:hypothetical protein
MEVEELGPQEWVTLGGALGHTLVSLSLQQASSGACLIGFGVSRDQVSQVCHLQFDISVGIE